MNTVETVHRDDMLKWCWEELTDHVESLEFAALAGNKPVELLNIAAKIENILNIMKVTAARV